MPTLQLKAELSADDLLQAVDQLGPTELNQFIGRVLALRARRQAPSLNQAETELLRQINQGLPQPSRERYRELIGKRQADALSAEEHEELLRRIDEVELEEARRVRALGELAQLRQVPLAALMNDLGIVPPTDG